METKEYIQQVNKIRDYLELKAKFGVKVLVDYHLSSKHYDFLKPYIRYI